MEREKSKVYVEVRARFTKEGALFPERFVWEDGREYEIDRVRDVRRAASTRAGGAGIRYTCRICGRDRYLFLEENRWFMERAES